MLVWFVAKCKVCKSVSTNNAKITDFGFYKYSNFLCKTVKL